MKYKSYLMHNYRIDVASGNPWRANKGRFGTAPAGARVNRYEVLEDDPWNTTGTRITLSKAGQARWEREKAANAMKSKKNRIEDDELEKLIDPYRWRQEDRENIKNIVDDASSIAKKGSQSLEGIFNKPTRGPRYDLSSMTDAELRSVLNREQMERQYNDYFNPPQLSTGQKFVKGLGTALDVASTVGGVVSLGMGIAIAANKLKKGDS